MNGRERTQNATQSLTVGHQFEVNCLLMASSHRSRGRPTGRLPTGNQAARLRGHSHFDCNRCITNLHCCWAISSLHGVERCICSARWTLDFMRDMVVLQSSSGSRTQPTIFLIIFRRVASRRSRFRVLSGRATRPKSTVGWTVASNNRRRNLRGTCLFTSHRRRLLNLAQAQRRRWSKAVLTLVAGSKHRSLPKYL